MWICLLAGILLLSSGAELYWPAGVSQVGHGVDILAASLDGNLGCTDAVCTNPGLMAAPIFNTSTWRNGKTFNGNAFIMAVIEIGKVQVG